MTSMLPLSDEVGKVEDDSMSAPELHARRLDPGILHQSKRWNTPTIDNEWEQITKRNPARDGFNHEETRDFTPQRGTTVGYAKTLVIEPSHPSHRAGGAGMSLRSTDFHGPE